MNDREYFGLLLLSLFGVIVSMVDVAFKFGFVAEMLWGSTWVALWAVISIRDGYSVERESKQ